MRNEWALAFTPSLSIVFSLRIPLFLPWSRINALILAVRFWKPPCVLFVPCTGLSLQVLLCGPLKGSILYCERGQCKCSQGPVLFNPMCFQAQNLTLQHRALRNISYWGIMNNPLFLLFSVCVYTDEGMSRLCVVSDCIASFLLMRDGIFP